MKVNVDGRMLDAQPGETVLGFLERNGVQVPHICYHPNLGPLQTCDSCVVEVNGKLLRACATPIADGGAKDGGLVIGVDTQKAFDARIEAVNRLNQNHNLYCTVCENNGECVLHDATHNLGIPHQDFKPKPYPVDASNPFYIYDPSQCLLIGRCVEACQLLVANEVIHIDWTLNPPRVVWDNNVPINESSCVSCGACVSACPVNALMEKTMLGKAGYLTGIEQKKKNKLIGDVKYAETDFAQLFLVSNIEAAMRNSQIKKTKTVCPYCAVGCSFDVWTKGREILKIDPQPQAPANGIATCVKGKFGWGHVNNPERIQHPLIRNGDTFRRASWEEALDLIVSKFKEYKSKYGPDSIAFVAGCSDSNEEAYLVQKLARTVIGNNNVDNCARYCQSPASKGLERTGGVGADTGSMEDVYNAELVVTMGSQTSSSHPVLAGKISRAKKLLGHKIISVDVMKHEFATDADLFISPQSGTDLILVNAVAKYIIDQGWEDKKFIEEKTTQYEDYKKSLEMYTLEFAEKQCDVNKNDIIKMAEMIHESKSTCILFAMGITQHVGGTEAVTAICNLLLLTGNYGRPGVGSYPLRGHCNVQGAGDFGALAEDLPGYYKVTDEKDREMFEKAWGVRLPTKKGLEETEIVEAINDGRLHAMWVMGEDKLLADSNVDRASKAFEKIGFFVYSDMFFTKTAEYADIVLPTAASIEKDGTFVNTERRIQRFYKAIEPLGESKPDWEVLQLIANGLGADWHYNHPSEIMDEVASIVPEYAGVNYERLEGYKSLQWPVSEDGTDTPYLYKDSKFKVPGNNGKAKFYPTKLIPPLMPDEDYEFTLDNARELEQFHWGNFTYKTEGLAQKTPSVFIEIPPNVAKDRHIKDGDMIKIQSRWGDAEAPALVSQSRVSGNRVYLPLLESGKSTVNRLTSDVRDPTVETPDFKETPVRIEKIADAEKSSPPLPMTNPRWHFNERIPTMGVDVEKKWQRPDYIPIVDQESDANFVKSEDAQKGSKGRH